MVFARLATCLEFGEQASFGCEFVVVFHAKNGVFAMAVLREKDWLTRRDFVKDLCIASKG